MRVITEPIRVHNVIERTFPISKQYANKEKTMAANVENSHSL